MQAWANKQINILWIEGAEVVSVSLWLRNKNSLTLYIISSELTLEAIRDDYFSENRFTNWWSVEGVMFVMSSW